MLDPISALGKTGGLVAAVHASLRLLDFAKAAGITVFAMPAEMVPAIWAQPKRQHDLHSAGNCSMVASSHSEPCETVLSSRQPSSSLRHCHWRGSLARCASVRKSSLPSAFRTLTVSEAAPENAAYDDGEDRVATLVSRLAETEAALEALISGQVDAVATPLTSAPVLLQDAQEALQRSEERYRDIVGG